MDSGKVLTLYRHILKAATSYPSIKRKAIIADIKVEFREGKTATGAEATRRRELALDSLERLLAYTSMERGSSDELVLSLRGPLAAQRGPPRPAEK